jgi:hypothetical protein
VASEVQLDLGTAGATCYFLIRSCSGQVWNVSSGLWGAYSTPAYAGYPVSMTEQGAATGFYVGNFPGAIGPGQYSVVTKKQAGGSPAESDRTVGGENFPWDGGSIIPLAALATSGQLGQFMPQKVARGVMVQNFLFDLVSDTDNKTPLTSGVVSGQILRDNGAFGPLQSGLVTEKGNGVYSVTLTSGDLNADTAFLFFDGVKVSGGNAVRRKFSFVLQRVSGH